MHFKTYSGDETTERRDAPSGRESKSSGRFGGEFRDSDEAPKRQEKEFRFDVDKTKSTSGKPTKKVDLGAAAFYKADPIPSSVSVINTNARVLIPLQTISDIQNPAVSKSTNENGSSDLLADVFGNAGTATTTAANTTTSNVLDDFDPRGVDSGANGDFGDFSSAFSSQAAPQVSARYILLMLFSIGSLLTLCFL